MKEIPVSKRNLVVAILLGVVVAVGVLAIENWPLHAEPIETAPNAEDDLVSTLAVTAVEKIFRVDYQEEKEAWLTRICADSTPAGCEVFSAGADRLWAKYLDAKSVVTASARAVQKIADNGSEQVWEMSISLSSPLPGSNKTRDTAYVVLVETGSGWKFDRFLMQAEIDAILDRQETSSIPGEEGSEQ